MTDQIDALNRALEGRYRIDGELGHGGMATVYRAHDLKHQREVALKVMKPELAKVVGAERFLQEIRLTAKLQHPHILPLFDSGEADGILYYVMPLVDGESLAARLKREGALDASDARRILREIVDALAEAHARGIVHRDVKPGNVLLKGRHAAVADFGVAKALTDASDAEQLTTLGVAIGTPRYMAPEQAAADPDTDHRADLFAVGVIGYELLTGVSPFAGDSAHSTLAAVLTKTPTPMVELRPGVPEDLVRIVERCLEKDPAERWQSAAELLDELEGADSAKYWVRERITFDGAYGDERMVLYLHFPRDREPPFQTVVAFPGASAHNTRSIDSYSTLWIDFLLKSGRAVALPVYRGTFERSSDLADQAREMSLPYAPSPRPTSLYTEHVTQWAKDLGRSIDYLETRPDLDAESLAYYGVSWGGFIASVMLAVEERFDVAVLSIAGFSPRGIPHPEVHTVTYAPRVSTPVLMLNGRYDHVYPLETYAIPMFQKLGTPDEHKRQVVSDGGHFVPRTELIRESLAWLDRYLGPVR